MLRLVAMADTHGHHGKLARKWARIPEDTDVLITHTPPLGFGDKVRSGERVGCEDLLRRVHVVRPRLHVFGHIHEDGGVWMEGGTTFVNATTDEGRRPALVVTWPPRVTGGGEVLSGPRT